MSQGELKCCGSPLFLKSKYGSGYNLVITRKRANQIENIYESNKSSDLNQYYNQNVDYNNEFDKSTERIIDLVQSTIPNAKLTSNINTELSFVLPTEMSKSFPHLFDQLDKDQNQLNILNVGISITTVEEVFLK